MSDTTCACVRMGKRCAATATQEDLLCNVCRKQGCKGYAALRSVDRLFNGQVLHLFCPGTAYVTVYIPGVPA